MQCLRIAHRARIGEEDMRTLVDMAHRIRDEGFAEGPAAMDERTWSLAMPLPAQGLHVPAVLGLAGPMSGVLKPRLEELALADARCGRALVRALANGPSPLAGRGPMPNYSSTPMVPPTLMRLIDSIMPGQPFAV
jgi:hypothetical protein